MYPGWDFSSAVSRFCQVFRDPLGQHAETRERTLVPRAVSIEAPKAGAYRQDGGKTRAQSILIIITVIIMGNVVFFFIQNISKHFFLVESGQNWPITGAEVIGSCQLWKKMRILDQNHGLHPRPLGKFSFWRLYKTDISIVQQVLFFISKINKHLIFHTNFAQKPNDEKKNNFFAQNDGFRDAWRTPKNVCVGVPSGVCALSQKTRFSPTLCKFYG